MHLLCVLGGPLLLMEFAYLLRGVDAEVVWITYQQAAESYAVLSSLENKLVAKGVQVRHPQFCISPNNQWLYASLN